MALLASVESASARYCLSKPLRSQGTAIIASDRAIAKLQVQKIAVAEWQKAALEEARRNHVPVATYPRLQDALATMHAFDCNPQVFEVVGCSFEAIPCWP